MAQGREGLGAVARALLGDAASRVEVRIVRYAPRHRQSRGTRAVRQAETNVQDMISSWPELKEWHLTPRGREQAAVAARELKGKKIDMIFSSDVLRTKETSEIIAKELGLPVTFDARLREIDTGDFNG